MPGSTIKYRNGSTLEQLRDLYLKVTGISSFLASSHSVVESKKVEIGGVQRYTVAKTFREEGTTYLAYHLRGTKDGNWRRWLNAQLYVVDSSRYTCHNYKSLSNELRISSAEGAYLEWGFDKFISKETLLGTEGYVRNDELHLRLSFSYGIDIFSEESDALHTNVKLVVQGQPVFANKEASKTFVLYSKFGSLQLLSIHSTVFERLFKERAGETEIALQGTDLAGFLHFLRVVYPPQEKLSATTVKAVYQVAKAYGAGYLLEKCNEHVVESKELSLADKLRLAEELKNNKLFDLLVRSLDKPRMEEFAVKAEVNVQLRAKAVERHFSQQAALAKVVFAQNTKDEGLFAYVIGNLTTRELAHLKRVEHKDNFTKETLIALFGKAHSLIP